MLASHENQSPSAVPIGAAVRRFLMKRIVLAAITCLSLLVALPAISAAHSSGRNAGRDHRPDDRGGQRNRPGDRHRDGDRLEHFRAQPAGMAGAVKSFQNGVLTITLSDGSTAAGTVTSDTRVSCEGMDRDSNSRDGGSSGSGDNGDRGDNGGHGDNGDNGDNGDRGDQNNDVSCVAMLQQPGTTVRDAELHVFGGEAVWEEVELGL
jgi:hypothetical protein